MEWLLSKLGFQRVSVVDDTPKSRAEGAQMSQKEIRQTIGRLTTKVTRFELELYGNPKKSPPLIGLNVQILHARKKGDNAKAKTLAVRFQRIKQMEINLSRQRANLITQLDIKDEAVTNKMVFDAMTATTNDTARVIQNISIDEVEEISDRMSENVHSVNNVSNALSFVATDSMCDFEADEYLDELDRQDRERDDQIHAEKTEKEDAHRRREEEELCASFPSLRTPIFTNEHHSSPEIPN